MFRWAPKSESLVLSGVGSPEASSLPDSEPSSLKTDHTDRQDQSDPLGKPGIPKSMSGWTQAVPFFLSAIFFLSRFFAVFAPLPLLLLYMQKGRKWAWAATVVNGALVAWLGGVSGFLFYLVFVLTLSLVLPELLVRKTPLFRSAVLTLLAMAVVAAGVALSYAAIQHVNLWEELTRYISTLVDYFAKSFLAADSALVDPSDINELKRSLVLEFPSAAATFALIMVWANLVLLIKANPNKLRERLGVEVSYLRKWKAPDYLVWPIILSGFFLLGDFGIVSDVSLNVFKFLMAVYVIQGLSILSYFYDVWGIRGLFRLTGLILPLLLSAPLIAGLGFFDLWFDFRSKIRQS